MRQYQVVATLDADIDLEKCYSYIVRKLKNPEAGDAFLIDFDETKDMLKYMAHSHDVGVHPLLRSRSLRRINFQRHDYFLLYRLEGERVEIAAVGHFLEDIENVIH